MCPHPTSSGSFVEGRVAVDLVFGRARRTCPLSGSLATIWSERTTRRWRLPGGAYRRRAPSGSPSPRRRRAGCRSACGPARSCCARTLPQGPFGSIGAHLMPPSARVALSRWVGASPLAHPGAVVPGLDAVGEAFAVAGPWPLTTFQNSSQSMAAEVPGVAARLVPLQIRVGQRHAQHLGLLHGGVDELLAQVVVADALDAPAHRLRAVGANRIRRAEHHQARPPPAVHRVLHHARCSGVPAHHQFSASKPWRWWKIPRGRCAPSRVHRARRAAAQRHLVHDRRAVDQPADHADVGPGERRVVEDRAVFGAAAVQRVVISSRLTRPASRRRRRGRGRGRLRPGPWRAGWPCA